MEDDAQHYKYNDIKDLSDDCAHSFVLYFSVIFKSFKICRKTFILQTINLTLILIILNFVVSPIIKGILNVNGSSLSGTNMAVSVIILLATSAIKGNKIFRWQTLFDAGIKASQKIFFSLLAIFAIIFGVKQYGQTTKN